MFCDHEMEYDSLINHYTATIYYEAPITAQCIPEPSSLRGSTLGTRTAEHKGCNWTCKLTDGCRLQPKKLGLATPSGICHRKKVNSTELVTHALMLIIYVVKPRPGRWTGRIFWVTCALIVISSVVCMI